MSVYNDRLSARGPLLALGPELDALQRCELTAGELSALVDRVKVGLELDAFTRWKKMVYMKYLPGRL